jgi:uncharacterized protein
VLVGAYALRGSTGFGGVAGMPLLALVVPIKLLVPVWTLLGMASSATIVGRERHHVSVRDLLAILPGCVLGVAIGLYFFATLEPDLLAAGLGVLIIAYGGHALWTTFRPSKPWQPALRGLAPVTGLIAGAVGTVFGTMASIPFAIYLDAKRLAKQQFRATLSAMILILSLTRGLGYIAVGEFSTDVWLAFAAALPLMWFGVYLGNYVHTSISEVSFRRLVSVVLISTGIPLLLR